MMTLFSEYGVSPAMSKKFRWNQVDELVQRIGETDLLLGERLQVQECVVDGVGQGVVRKPLGSPPAQPLASPLQGSE